MKELEDQIAGDLQALVTGKWNKAVTLQTLVITLVLAAFAVAGLLSYLFMHAIKSGFTDLVQVAESLAEGDLEVAMPEASENELGRITAAFKVFRTNILDGRVAEKENRENEARRMEDNARVERESLEAKVAQEDARRSEREATEAHEKKTVAEISAVVSACAVGDFSQRIETRDKDCTLETECDGEKQNGEVTYHGWRQIKGALKAMSEGD